MHQCIITLVSIYLYFIIQSIIKEAKKFKNNFFYILHFRFSLTYNNNYIHLNYTLSFNYNKRGDWQRQKWTWNLTVNKWWNWSGCTKLAVSASWTHGLNRNQWLWVQIPLRPTFYSYFKESYNDEYYIPYIVVITTAQLHSTKPELSFCAGSGSHLLAVCRWFEMVRISDDGPSWK